MTAALQLMDLEDWIEATAASVVELTAAIGVGTCAQSAVPLLGPSEPSGAYIPLVGARISVQVGLQSDDEGCRAMSKALLDMTDDELAPDIVKDATCEIVNMLAGLVKRRMLHLDSSLRLGLPVFVQGHIRAGSGTISSGLHFRAGAVPLSAIVFRPRV